VVEEQTRRVLRIPREEIRKIVEESRRCWEQIRTMEMSTDVMAVEPIGRWFCEPVR